MLILALPAPHNFFHLPPIVPAQMLRSEDVGVHYEAVGVIGNLVHSSQNIKRRVLEEQALQPVINLLGSSCPDSQREAALLLGQVRGRGGGWLGGAATGSG